MINFIRSNRVLLLSICSGLILSLSWPLRGFPFLIFTALVPLFFVEDHILKNARSYTKSSVLLASWLAFLVFNLLTTWWIAFATLPGMLVAVILNSFLMAIPWALMHLSRKILPARHSPASIIVYWLAFEHLHSLWDLNWNWLDLGNVFSVAPAVVQWYEYTGAPGGSLWIIVINLLIYLFLKELLVKTKEFRKLFWYPVLLAAGVAVPIIFSLNTAKNYSEESHPVEIVIIQPNEDPYDEAENHEESLQRINKMLELARSKISPDTRFIVAPEGASPRGIWQGKEDLNLMVSRIREFQEETSDATWIFGSFTYQIFEDKEKAPDIARQYGNNSKYYVAYNSAVMVAKDSPVEYYHKSKLVPGIEQMPFHSLLAPLGRLVEAFGGISGSLGKQESCTVFNTEKKPVVAPVICYESIYGDYMKDYMRMGAEIIFIITNDGWWRNTPGYRQHNQYAALRAIESRRSIARAASTGISSFFNQKGEIIKETQWNTTAAISARLNLNKELSFYSKHGNYLGRISVFVSLLLLLYLITQGIIRYSK